MDWRADNYHKVFPRWPPVSTFGDDYIYGVWKIGNDYRNKSSYYGAYPNGYLKRIYSLFPDYRPEDKLHLFAGSVDDDGVKFDLIPRTEKTISGDAHSLEKYFPNNRFSLVLADPPYSKADAEKYGTPMVNRKKVMSSLTKIVKPGGYVVWLDTVLPMYRKDEWKLVMEIGIVRSTNHRVRFVFSWRKL